MRLQPHTHTNKQHNSCSALWKTHTQTCAHKHCPITLGTFRPRTAVLDCESQCTPLDPVTLYPPVPQLPSPTTPPSNLPHLYPILECLLLDSPIHLLPPGILGNCANCATQCEPPVQTQNYGLTEHALWHMCASSELVRQAQDWVLKAMNLKVWE